MKKYLFAALGAGLLMTSCQSDEPLAPGNGLEQQVAFTVSLPDAVSTRAGGTNSAAGGVSNNVGANVTFNVALYLDGRLVFADNQTVSSTGNHTSATFEPTLVIGENYQLVAFAEFDNDATATGQGKTPETNMGLINIESGINNELNDEYFVSTTLTAAPELSATLKRPYGKLRLIAEDLHEAERQFGSTIESVEVTYKYTRPTNFNVIAGTFDPAYTEGAQTYTAEYGVYGADTNDARTIFVDYIPGKFDGSESMMPFTVTVNFANGKTYTRDFRQDIPVKRNWLTTLKGRLFTIDSDLTLTIEEGFEGETELNTQYTYYAVKNKEQLEAALTSNDEHIYVELDADVEYDVAAWQNKAMGGDKTQSITITGEQVLTRGSYPTLTFNQTNSDWNNIATNNGAKLILKNLNVTNSGRNDGPWNRHDLNFACDVEMTNVISDKAIALKAGGVLKNVTINDKNASDTYALWIQPKGQVVTLEGCEINMIDCTDGRGIKIDEQYLDANEVKAPTLNVSGTTFKTEEKAAVIVKSKDGAIINWREGNDISEVEADSTFAVWVDEASETYADKVIVNGAYKTIEGKSAVAKSDAEISTAIQDGKTTIALTAGTYVIPAAAKGKTLAFVGTGNPEDVKIATNQSGSYEGCNYALDGSTVVFENITITTDGKTYTGYARCNGTYKNCVINNTYTLYGNSVFENCTFNVNGDAYNIWTWGAPNATFNNCTFNCDGKSMLLYGQANTKLTMNNCVFNDNGGLDELKAAIEIGNDYNKSYELIVNKATVNGFAINDKGINTGTTLWANKNSMPQDKLNVVVDGVDVY